MYTYRNRIMIVDDDAVMLMHLESMLEDRYEVLTAENGKQALKILSDAMRMDLLILDIEMPEIDGYELMEHVRELPVCMDVPAIFLTGVTGHEAEIRGLNTGVVDYINKPFHPEVLLARVSNALRSARRLDLTKLPPTKTQLTDAEIEILQMIALSYSNEDIAERMGYSYGYVRQLVSRALPKINVENRRDMREFLYVP